MNHPLRLSPAALADDCLLYYIAENKVLPTATNIEASVQQLFHKEWGNLVSVLIKVFGTHNMQLAEDVVQDSFAKATGDWTINGIPHNPAAWLFTVARNKATDVLRRQQKNQLHLNGLSVLLQSEYSLSSTLHHLIINHTIDDDKLRMMFVCCHPSLSAEASVTLILKTICGLTVAEIAKAFFSKADAIEKRLYRAKQIFRENSISFELPADKALPERLHRVLLCIYLLFNEGYNSTQHESLIRTDCMHEAIQLCSFILSSSSVPHEEAHALMSLMCFTAARNEARLDNEGNILLLLHQDRSRWNKELIQAGIVHLEHSANGTNVSNYHLEAGIAYEHAKAKEYKHTNWQQIIHCYDLLLHLQPSPFVALNRAIAIGELYGAAAGIEAINGIEGIAFLNQYYLLPATMGELCFRSQQYENAITFFEQAILLTKSVAEQMLLHQKIETSRQQMVLKSSL